MKKKTIENNKATGFRYKLRRHCNDSKEFENERESRLYHIHTPRILTLTKNDTKKICSFFIN